MNTYTIKYEAGAGVKTVTATGTDIHDAIRSLGFHDSDTFMALRLVTWSRNGGVEWDCPVLGTYREQMIDAGRGHLLRDTD